MSRPKCRECGTSTNVSWTPMPGTIPGAAHAGRWLCGDCLYLETHPEAQRREAPKRTTPVQDEMFPGAR